MISFSSAVVRKMLLTSTKNIDIFLTTCLVQTTDKLNVERGHMISLVSSNTCKSGKAKLKVESTKDFTIKTDSKIDNLSMMAANNLTTCLV